MNSRKKKYIYISIRFRAALTYNSTPANIIGKIYSHSVDGFSAFIRSETSAVLRLECSLDCVSGSWVTSIIVTVYCITASVSYEKKKNVIKPN